nr:hypothetical protein [Microctonus hyperodae filamentous virus]
MKRPYNLQMNRYKELLKTKSVLVPCGSCGERMLARHVNAHTKEAHDLLKRGTCIWCWDYKWKRCDGQNHYAHRYACLRQQITAAKQQKIDARKQARADARIAREEKNRQRREATLQRHAEEKRLRKLSKRQQRDEKKQQRAEYKRVRREERQRRETQRALDRANNVKIRY